MNEIALETAKRHLNQLPQLPSALPRNTLDGAVDELVSAIECDGGIENSLRERCEELEGEIGEIQDQLDIRNEFLEYACELLGVEYNGDGKFSETDFLRSLRRLRLLAKNEGNAPAAGTAALQETVSATTEPVGTTEKPPHPAGTDR